jgi:twitching motility protein PilU
MQREAGVGTKSWEAGLHNALRQAPDVVVFGEILSAEIMNYGLEFSRTGNLALATLHANQAIDRILGFFPIETRSKLMQDISVNLRAIHSQRLVKTVDGGRWTVFEILLNTPLISEYIAKGEASSIKPLMIKSRELGMQTFDQALLELYQTGKIDYKEALRNAGSQNELRLQITLTCGEDRARGGLSLQSMDDGSE